MIAAFDVHYRENGSASAAAILFWEYRDPEPAAEFLQLLPEASKYIPGEFYRRELPCILELLRQIEELPNEIIIDGYVMLGDKPGLGQYLFNSLDGKIPIVGVAKSKFKDSSDTEVFGGRSKNPLYVTSAGVDLQRASEKIRMMHGPYRLPALLKRVDLLARVKIQKID
jgi:deoxyribonuclease V